ncbi:MAG: hypothetical protein E5V64_06035 [Mesorhizobium sp.]|uniref:hypothetical protein n=1 Tax=Mesorhizobium sp. TaxID=1871066 RepID=UPI0012274C02|nr:hypothetical protein [Mesorhizobium sp.]TIV83895.1 MAG: hypothetical protein E5V64_06035 [Mesorhizobium sp.]
MIATLYTLLGGLGGVIRMVLAGVVVASLMTLYNALVENPGVRAQERALVLAEARAAALALIAKRSEDNVEINSLDQSGLCAELGGRWVPNENRCD